MTEAVSKQSEAVTAPPSFGKKLLLLLFSFLTCLLFSSDSTGMYSALA